MRSKVRAASKVAFAEGGRRLTPAISDSSTPVYSGYMSRLPICIAWSTISELPMSLLSSTGIPCARSAWA